MVTNVHYLNIKYLYIVHYIQDTISVECTISVSSYLIEAKLNGRCMCAWEGESVYLAYGSAILNMHHCTLPADLAHTMESTDVLQFNS